MKLMYSIPGKIWWIQNFLDYNAYKGIHNAVIKQRNKINLHSTKGIWPNNLIDRISAPQRSQISDYKPFEMLKTLVKHNVCFQMKDVKDMSSIVHYMQKGAGINWHDDGSWKYGATYYLNNKWNKHWGGEFMFTDNVGHGWIPVVGNSLIIVKAPIEHKVNPVLTTVMPRISIQIFAK
tara:strand:+ start:531 stop:1064 length:534 start_codon:yes stop_codon:yes gene_type:complete